MAIAHEDHYGPWTIAEVLGLGEDRGQRRELAGDTLLLSPMPGTGHQRASSALARVLHGSVRAAGLGLEVLRAVNVVLPDGLFVPDVAVIDAAVTAEDPIACHAGAVHLVAEVVAPTSAGRRIDRLLKPPYYAQAGIEHLWRLELEPSPTLIVAELEGGRYVDRLVAEPGRKTLIEKPFAVEVDPGALVRPAR